MNAEEQKAYDLVVKNHELAMDRVAELEREITALSAHSLGEQVREPDVDLAMHLLSDRWPESSERIEVEVFAEWLRDLLAASPSAASQKEQGE